jgi:hypothetical protein
VYAGKVLADSIFAHFIEVGDNYAQGFKCQNCGSRYIIRSIIKDMESIEPILLIIFFLLIILVYIIYYSFSPLVPYYGNRR